MALTRIANIASTIPDDSIANVKMANIVQSKNIIINGDMQIAQRATSSTGVTSGNYYTCDRWFIENTTMGTFTISQSTDVPSGQGFASSLKYDCTTADASPASGDTIGLRQKFEGQNLQYLKFATSSAESLTLSFWIKSNKTGTYNVALFGQDSASTEQYLTKAYTISSADTWEKKTITYIGNTANGFDNDNARSLDLTFNFGTGSSNTGGTLQTVWSNYGTSADYYATQGVNIADSTSNELYITGVQLEAGDTASEFEFLPYGLNLERCLRYFYPIISISDTNNLNAFGYYYASGNIKIPIRLPTQMRTTPTLSQDVDTDALRFYRDATYDGLSGNFALDGNGTGRYVSMANSTDASGTAGQAGQLYKYTPTQADSYIWLSAEL